MKTSRPYYPTKAAWAAAQARAYEQEARLYPTVRSSDWRGVQSRMRALRNLRAEARRFEVMADRYKSQGL